MTEYFVPREDRAGCHLLVVHDAAATPPVQEEFYLGAASLELTARGIATAAAVFEWPQLILAKVSTLHEQTLPMCVLVPHKSTIPRVDKFINAACFSYRRQAKITGTVFSHMGLDPEELCSAFFDVLVGYYHRLYGEEPYDCEVAA